VQGLAIASDAAYGAEMTNLQENQEITLLSTIKLTKADMFKSVVGSISSTVSSRYERTEGGQQPSSQASKRPKVGGGEGKRKARRSL
jgi:hypothetical protein